MGDKSHAFCLSFGEVFFFFFFFHDGKVGQTRSSSYVNNVIFSVNFPLKALKSGHHDLHSKSGTGEPYSSTPKRHKMEVLSPSIKLIDVSIPIFTKKPLWLELSQYFESLLIAQILTNN